MSALAKTKNEQVVRLLKRARGATRPEILKATGWLTVNVYDYARRAGLSVETVKEGRVLRYFGKPDA